MERHFSFPFLLFFLSFLHLILWHNNLAKALKVHPTCKKEEKKSLYLCLCLSPQFVINYDRIFFFNYYGKF